MKQKIEIELDVPEGYELTGEYRYPRQGEPFVTSTGTACVCHDNDQCGRRMNRIILRKLWTPPAWLPGGCWVYVNACGEWKVSRSRPIPINEACQQFFTPQGESLRAPQLWHLHGEEFAPPPVSKIKIVRCGAPAHQHDYSITF